MESKQFVLDKVVNNVEKRLNNLNLESKRSLDVKKRLNLLNYLSVEDAAMVMDFLSSHRNVKLNISSDAHATLTYRFLSMFLKIVNHQTPLKIKDMWCFEVSYLLSELERHSCDSSLVDSLKQTLPDDIQLIDTDKIENPSKFCKDLSEEDFAMATDFLSSHPNIVLNVSSHRETSIAYSTLALFLGIVNKHTLLQIKDMWLVEMSYLLPELGRYSCDDSWLDPLKQILSGGHDDVLCGKDQFFMQLLDTQLKDKKLSLPETELHKVPDSQKTS